MTHPTINDTLELIKKYHKKLDKTGDIPYFWHLVRVMLRINTIDENILHAALLHDIVEDTQISLKKLEDMGYNEKIVNAVRWCSRNEFPNLNFIEWMTLLGKEAPIETIYIKIADISDNLGFERMRGLMTRSDNDLYPKNSAKKNKKMHQYPLQKRIENKVKQQMRLHGEMGVYDRYYKGWNCMFLNESLLPLIKEVNISDFCNIEDLLKIKNWLPQDDFNRYFEANKLNCWTIEGRVKVIKDRGGNDYLALNINNCVGEIFQQFLTNHISIDCIQNQQIRDNGSFHITLINAMQYKKLINENKFDIVNSLNDQIFNLYNYGIGTVINDKSKDQAWFSVLENAYLDNFREKLNLNKQDFHITLGFKEKDVFSKPKNKSTLIFKPNILWNYLSTPVKKPKLKF